MKISSHLSSSSWCGCSDVLVFSKNVEEHEKRMRLVFHALRQANLKLKPKKCRLFQKSVTYLGYKLSPEGIASDENKLNAVREWKRPENVTEVMSFLGFCSYYRRFIKGCVGIAKSLHHITKCTAVSLGTLNAIMRSRS